MGLLIEGKWQDQWYDTKSTGGRFVRKDSQFRDWVTSDGSSGFKAEIDRYHLYVSLACPWAHRTLILRKIKKLEDVISLSIVDPLMQENGWEFSDYEGSIKDTANGSDYLHQVYTAAKPDYTGRVTVPVLWDNEKQTIVNNESSEIIIMLNSQFDEFGDSSKDYYPEDLRTQIEQINEVVYDNINNGVYKCGFATTQQAYEEAFKDLFSTLDQVDGILSEQRYLVGNKLSISDWRLFTTLIRFDSVYYTHFKCNLKRIEEYPHISNYLRELYQYPGIEDTVNFKHIKEHYFKSHKTINPTGIVPAGPKLDFSRAHNRSEL